MKILIIEDEENIAKPIISLLKERNYEVDYEAHGNKGLELAKINKYNCIILDLNLPHLDGFEVLEAIRNNKDNTPILILSARSEMTDKLKGFRLGVDDYVTKPFDLEELLARIDSLIRRSSLNSSTQLSIADMLLYPRKNIVERKGKTIALSTKETALLEYFLRNKGVIISTEELLEFVWDTEINILTDTVRTTVKTLRKKIDPEKSIIKTIRGKGYLVTE